MGEPITYVCVTDHSPSAVHRKAAGSVAGRRPDIPATLARLLLQGTRHVDASPRSDPRDGDLFLGVSPPDPRCSRFALGTNPPQGGRRVPPSETAHFLRFRIKYA